MQCNIGSLNEVDKEIIKRIESTVETFVSNIFKWQPLIGDKYDFSKHENQIFVLPSQHLMHIKIVSEEGLTDGGCIIKEGISFPYNGEQLCIHTHVKSCSEGSLAACSDLVQDKCSRGRFDPSLCEQATDRCGKKWKDLLDIASSTDIRSNLSASFIYSEQQGRYTPAVDGVLSNLGLTFYWPTKEFIDALMVYKVKLMTKYGQDEANDRLQALFDDIGMDIVDVDLVDSVTRAGSVEERLTRNLKARSRPSFPAEKMTEEEFKKKQDQDPSFYYVWYDGLWVNQQFHFCFVPMSTILL